jgi:hypothetical protein
MVLVCRYHRWEVIAPAVLRVALVGEAAAGQQEGVTPPVSGLLPPASSGIGDTWVACGACRSATVVVGGSIFGRRIGGSVRAGAAGAEAAVS